MSPAAHLPRRWWHTPPVGGAVGPAWRCGAGGPWSIISGNDGGADRVGFRTVVWVRLSPTELRVAHDGAAAPLALLLRAAVPGVEEYTVRLTAAQSGATGARVWWACPCCGRLAGKLYLPPTRARLACRTCCGLAYASQYDRRRRTGRARRRRGT